MSEQFVISGQDRNDQGKGASRRLRRTAKIPGILYGGKQAPQSISLAENELMRAIQFESFYASVIELNIDGKKQSAIVKDMQRHPYKNLLLHVDFMRVSANTELHVHVPIHYINEEVCVGAKAGGLVNRSMLELYVSCLPKDLPEYIEVDIADLDIGDSIHISQITLPKGVSSIDLGQGEDHDLSLVSIMAPRGGAADDEDEEIGDSGAADEAQGDAE